VDIDPHLPPLPLVVCCSGGLALIGKTGESEKELADRFIEKVKSMNRNMDIPNHIKELEEKDIPLIAQRALREANPDYPVPTLMNQAQREALVRKLLP
jgi:alcohol dehydrogenase class IV